MGTMQHHAIVVTAGHGDYIDRAHAKALEIFGAGPVTGIVDGVTNHVRSFMVGPDGSKAGWDESDKGDAQRATFVEWLETQRYGDGSGPIGWLVVAYGENERDGGDFRYEIEYHDRMNYGTPGALR